MCVFCCIALWVKDIHSLGHTSTQRNAHTRHRPSFFKVSHGATANGNTQMIQRRDHLTFPNTEDAPKSNHLNIPFVHETKGLPAFYAQPPTYGVSLLTVAMRLDFPFASCFPVSCATVLGFRWLLPEPQSPSFSLPHRFLRVLASFQSGHPKCPHLHRHRPSLLPAWSISTPPPLPLPTTSPSLWRYLKRNFHDNRYHALFGRHPVPESQM